MIPAFILAVSLAQPPGQPATPAQVPTPTDVKPGSINLEDVQTPEIFNRELVKFLKSDLGAPTQNRD